MKINLSPLFEKHFQKRIKNNQKLVTRFETRLKTFIKDPQNSSLRNHQLKGLKKGLYSFSITGDYRVIYKYSSKDEVTLVDIGTHNQVY